MNVFNRNITVFFVVSIALSLGLIGLQRIKPIQVRTPNLYVLQNEKDNQDRIIKTNDGGNSYEVLYNDTNIQNFGVSGSSILVSKGERFKTSTVSVYDMSSKTSQPLDLKDKYIEKIFSLSDRFVFLYEDMLEGNRTYRSVLGVFNPKTKTLENPNPQFFAVDVANVIIHPNQNTIMFSGFGGYRYLMDLNNYEKVLKLDTKFSYVSSFIDEVRFINSNYNANEFFLYDLSNKTNTSIPLKNRYFQDIVGSSEKYFYNYTDVDLKSNKYIVSDKDGPLTPPDSKSSYEFMNIDPKGEFIAVSEFQESELVFKNNVSKNIQPTLQIIDINKKSVTTNKLRFKSYTW